jgi:hypothetical protein
MAGGVFFAPETLADITLALVAAAAHEVMAQLLCHVFVN